MKKIVRITTVPESLKILLKGQLSYISQYYSVIAIASNGEDLFELAVNDDIAVFPVNMTRRITPLKDLRSLIKLVLLLKKLNPEFVHTHTPKAGLLGMMASWLTRVPNRMHTVAGLPLMEVKGFKRFILILAERITYMCATKIYPNSYGLNEFIIKYIYNRSDKIKVLANGSSNGIDLDYFKIEIISNATLNLLRSKLELFENHFVYVFIGRIVSDKGINELVKAFTKVNRIYKNTKLLLVGKNESELDPLYPETDVEIKTNPNIIYIGFVSDVRPYLAISNCLVFPSYREGFPNVVLQAAAMGLPCIVSNINGCNEIIENGYNGIIIEVKNIDSLRNAMLNLLIDIVLYKKLNKNARASIEKKYDRRLVWDAILNEYKSLDF